MNRKIFAANAPRPPVEVAPATVSAIVEMHTGHIDSFLSLEQPDVDGFVPLSAHDAFLVMVLVSISN